MLLRLNCCFLFEWLFLFSPAKSGELYSQDAPARVWSSLSSTQLMGDLPGSLPWGVKRTFSIWLTWEWIWWPCLKTSAARTMTLQVIKLTFLDNLADRSLLSRCVSSIFTAQIIVITVSFCKNASTDILHAMFSISIVHQFAAYPGPFCTNITRSAEASFTLPQWSVFLGHQSRPADAASKLLWSISPGLVQQAPPMWGM